MDKVLKFLGKRLSQKSDFQSSTIKPDNIGNPAIKTGQIWLQGGFQGGFVFKKIKKFYLDKKSKLIHFKSEKFETSTIFFF